MGFDAGKIVDKLDWNFRPYVDASGTTPEPSSDKLTNFQFKMRELGERMGSFGPNDPDSQRELLGVVQELSREEMSEAWDDLNKELAELCSNNPSYEDLTALQKASFRHHRAYLGWLIGELMDPEVSSAVTNQSLVDRNGATRTLRSVKN